MAVVTPTQTTTEAPALNKQKNRFAAIAKIVVWQIIALLFVELILSWAGLGEEEIFRLDRDLGTRHMTNKRITWRTEGYAQSYFDANGMREPGLTVAKPANTYRVALLGDSMVEGLQVPIESTFGQILSKKLSHPGAPQIQFLNFGTSGYSTVQEYLQLKKLVFKYKPNLVLLCYNSRDMFENWAPPDQVLTNVRPVALHLPGGKLIVSNVPVLDWMRSPRAKFLMEIDWLRQHSRIWGLISAMELELGFHNPIYKAVMHFLTEPSKAVKELGTALNEFCKSTPSFAIKTFEDNTPKQHATVSDNQPQTTAGFKPEFNSAAPNAVLEKNPIAKASKNANAGYNNYISLMDRTLGSLIAAMSKECHQAGANFAVITLPVKASLCPDSNPEKDVFGIDYLQEVAIVETICKQQNIAMLNCEQLASQLPVKQRTELFYMIHLTPKGHRFMAAELESFVSEQMKASHP